jgi:hypothetical protein
VKNSYIKAREEKRRERAKFLYKGKRRETAKFLYKGKRRETAKFLYKGKILKQLKCSECKTMRINLSNIKAYHKTQQRASSINFRFLTNNFSYFTSISHSKSYVILGFQKASFQEFSLPKFCMQIFCSSTSYIPGPY